MSGPEMTSARPLLARRAERRGSAHGGAKGVFLRPRPPSPRPSAVPTSVLQPTLWGGGGELDEAEHLNE